MRMENKINTKLEELSTPGELVSYLDSPRRMQSSQYLYQYTTISALINMIRTHTMHLGNAKYMNDQLEYQNGSSDVWNNLFFTCFMMEDDESIGMWSMYAQPWRDGIKISIPKDILKKWVSEVHEIIEISQETKRPTGRKLDSLDEFRVWISAVAYSNAEGINLKKTSEFLQVGTVKNELIHNPHTCPELTGYIKDMAWSYEKELRIKAQFDNWQGFQRVAISLPDYVINSMIITASPLFEGDLTTRLKEAIQEQLGVGTSKFTGKLSIRNACDSCSLTVK